MPQSRAIAQAVTLGSGMVKGAYAFKVRLFTTLWNFELQEKIYQATI
jgi:hypothetical protein